VTIAEITSPTATTRLTLSWSKGLSIFSHNFIPRIVSCKAVPVIPEIFSYLFQFALGERIRIPYIPEYMG
jgi:hypothetical protein